MNRPNKELLTEWSLNSYADYTNELEKYCDELEKTLKVCKFVISNGTNRNRCSNCPFKNECDYENMKCNKLEDWKEWLLKDDIEP